MDTKELLREIEDSLRMNELLRMHEPCDLSIFKEDALEEIDMHQKLLASTSEEEKKLINDYINLLQERIQIVDSKMPD